MTKLEAHGKGDINDDGKIDLRDLMMCLNHVGGKEELEGEQFERADINSDEEVNIVDLMKLLNHVGRKALLNGELELNINVNYFNRKLTLWASNANDQEQPVVIPEQENVSIPTKLTTSPSFDLALRKYITKINGEELIGQNTRVPSIDESTLQSGTTATYNHKKDPVAVETGNIVTYNITIYNEGNKEGRATKIVDQLPEGVKFSKVVSGNFELGNYDKTTNRVTLNRKTDNTENLAVYEAGKLDSETIEIECEVTATADNQEKVLTNVAWIEEEYDAIDNVTITNQEGADIDSEPETKPEVNKDNMENYTGKEEHEDLTNPEMYYKGQQDDDDFEKLILEKAEGNYTIDLVKQDGETKDKLSGAIFNVNGEDKTATNVDGVINLGTVEITNTETPDVYVIKETSSPEGYNKFEGSIELSIAKKLENGKYVVDTENTRMVVKNSEGTEITENVPVAIDKTTGKITITIDNEKKEFDLALRKFIIAVSNDETIEENEYLRNEDGTYTREPFVDTSLLNTKDEEGNLITTATYNHSKEPIYVRKGDIVIYTIRVYNEGEINGYAQQVTDYLPEELEFLPDHEINQQYEWTIEGNKISTDYLSKEKETEERENLIQSFDGDIYYKDVQIACKVKDDVKTSWKITNLAQITEDSNQNGDEENDRDSTPDGGFDEPEGEERPIYKDDETGEYIPGQEDDDDFEKILVEEFDLALRKFIIAVSEDETIEENEYLKNEDGSYTREPIVDTSKLNTKDEEGNLITTAKYNHTKESILVQKNDIVIYMLRVYNEGDINGYAAEIKDHLPPYLEYVDSEFNNQYGWEVSEDGRTLTTRYLEDSLINKPEVNEEGEYKLSYQEVPVMCRVMESVPTNEEITNIADITEYQDDKKEETIDRDSESDNIELPDDENLPEYQDEKIKNGDEYIPGQEDDDDFEKIIVKEFDLALRKWVTEAIVIENGQQTITTTGHEPYDEPEEIVKVELHRKKLNQVEVKFRYKIRVTNEGDIAGYVKEITDYIPEGLKFVAEDNPGWTDEGNNVISTTLTESILLQPGEYTEVEVVLTWINSEDNMGVMTNIAEISKDENEYGIPDKDSTPDNQRQGEDDIDDAPVMLSISTGKAVTYFMLGVVVLITIAGGIILIKKFVI